MKTSLLNIVMQLRKCCNHPYLFEGAEPEPFEAGEHLVENCGKMLILDKLLKNLKEKGSRVLVFSQMAQMIDIVEDYLVYREWAYCRIDGRTSVEDRVSAIDEFNAPGSEKFVFLLTTRAGGLGINLTSADTVVIYDSDWNPQADLQAQDRAHRIGQTKEVNVFRLVTEDTIEEGIVLRAQQKLKLDDILIKSGHRKMSTALSQGELMDILSAGMNVDAAQDTAGADISIEEILRRGEEKTREMKEKLDAAKIADAVDGHINMYQWEGEDYFRQRIQECVGEDVFDAPQDTLVEGRHSRGLFGARKYKRLVFPDYQFYPRELETLQDKEEELAGRGESLNEEDEAKKKELLSQGFSWTKRDFKAFVASVERYGDDLGAARAALPHRPDVAAYSSVFWNRLDELADAERIRANIGRNTHKRERKTKLKEIFAAQGDGIEEHILSKNRLYVDNVYLLRLYAEFIDDPDCYMKMKAAILSNDLFMFDYFLNSRTVQELAKHVHTLTGQLLKAFSDEG